MQYNTTNNKMSTLDWGTYRTVGDSTIRYFIVQRSKFNNASEEVQYRKVKTEYRTVYSRVLYSTVSLIVQVRKYSTVEYIQTRTVQMNQEKCRK